MIVKILKKFVAKIFAILALKLLYKICVYHQLKNQDSL